MICKFTYKGFVCFPPLVSLGFFCSPILRTPGYDLVTITYNITNNKCLLSTQLVLGALPDPDIGRFF